MIVELMTLARIVVLMKLMILDHKDKTIAVQQGMKILGL